MERERSLKTSSVGRSWGTSARLVGGHGGKILYEACIVTWQMGLLHMPAIGLDWGDSGIVGIVVCIIL